MKTTRVLFVFLFSFAFLLTNCKKDDDTSKNDYGFLPSKFKVDIPSSICQSVNITKSLKTASGDTIKGDDIYQHLRTFIFVGESAADIVEKIMLTISVNHIDRPMDLMFIGEDDNRAKHLEVMVNASDTGYKYLLVISDSASINNADGGKAIEVKWNVNPVHGVAILKPYNISRLENLINPDAMFKIEYSEASNSTYDAQMMVEITGFNVPEYERFAMSSLKMFVGKKGDRVDVYGNSEHPNASFYTEDKGFDWAFVASGYEQANIGAAEVGLPPMNLNSNERKVLLEDYSIKNVFTNEINNWFLDHYGWKPSAEVLSNYLKNADAPGYFNNEGFVKAGTSPNADYNSLSSQLKVLIPFNPKEINELNIKFDY